MTDHPDDVQLSRLIDGDLSLTSREAVMAHLRLCPACSQRHDQLVAVTATLRLESPLLWTSNETESVLGRLPQRRHRVRVAVAGGVSLVMCGLVVVEAAPLIAATLASVGVVVGLSGVLTPPAVAASGPQLLVVVAAIAILAPLAAYPLARWR
jgi:anti-sigma factor RsiW